MKLPAGGGKNDPRPVLLKRVKLFDPVARTIGPETTLLLEDGRSLRRRRRRRLGAEGRDRTRRGGPGGPPRPRGHRGRLTERSFTALLALGVTTVRDAGGSVAAVRSLAAR